MALIEKRVLKLTLLIADWPINCYKKNIKTEAKTETCNESLKEAENIGEIIKITNWKRENEKGFLDFGNYGRVKCQSVRQSYRF